MKKIFVLSATALMFTGMAFASHGDKGKNKKCGKAKTCCTKGAPAKASVAKVSKTAKM